MSEPITAFPLTWPYGKRRHQSRRRSSAFKTNYDRTIREVKVEVARLGGSELLISSNLPLRRDGFPISARNPPSDPGVAVYFQRRSKPVCFACDRWPTVADNLHSIYLTINALRGIERWGSGEMMEAAFTGFVALPAPEQWFTILRVSVHATPDEIKLAHRRLVAAHPEFRTGGAASELARINTARDEGLQRATQ